MKTGRAKSKSLDRKSASKSTRKNKRVYCLCKGPDDGRFMIGCDVCNDWFHVGCVGMTKATANKLKSFTCPPCSGKADKSIITTTTDTKDVPVDNKNEAKPTRLAKRTKRPTVTSDRKSSKRRKAHEDKDEEEDEGEEHETAEEDTSEHNESEVEDDDEEKEEEEEEEEKEEEEEAEHAEDAEESTYEQERKRRMEENQRFLQSLGLLDVKKSLGMSFDASGPSRKYTGKRHRWSAGDAGDVKGDDSFECDDEGLAKANFLGPVRKSRRLQNEPALDYSQIKKEVVKELAERPVIRRARGTAFAQSRGFHGNGRVPATEHIVAPFSLASVGTTIWSLGRIYEGDASPEKYYSSKQCMYRHPYPVGYRASIVKWGSVWIMEINEGPDGPRFVVRQKTDDEAEDGTPLAASPREEQEDKGHESFDGEEEEQQQEGADNKEEGNAGEQHEQKKRKKTFKRFEGPSATQPWTKACITGPSPGSRVSGPLLFGFSDPLTVHILNRLRKATAEAEY